MSDKKPKLLLIAGYFPPVRISTGSIRPWNISRCLIDIGWDVTVVTPKISIWDPNNLDDVENKKKMITEMGLKMIYTGHLLKCLAPWRYKLPQSKIYWFFGGILRVITRYLRIQNWVGWVPSALYACRKLKPDDVDVILATGAPFWGFEIAYQLAKRLKKPYVLDYRDLWTDNPFNKVKKNWVVNHEKRLVNNCSVIICVSPLSSKVLSEKYHLDEKMYTITNGYDSNDFKKVVEKRFDHFSIIFAGSIIPPKRSLFPLIQALILLNLNHPLKHNWQFHYLGPNTVCVKDELRKYDLEEKAIFHGLLPRHEALSFIKGASLNVVLSVNSLNPTSEEKGVIPGKIYELIGLGANILSIVPKGSSVEKILSTVGVKSFDPCETEQISNFIVECMDGKTVNIVNKEKYSWEYLSQDFDHLLKKVIQEQKKS